MTARSNHPPLPQLINHPHPSQKVPIIQLHSTKVGHEPQDMSILPQPRSCKGPAAVLTVDCCVPVTREAVTGSTLGVSESSVRHEGLSTSGRHVHNSSQVPSAPRIYVLLGHLDNSILCTHENAIYTQECPPARPFPTRCLTLASPNCSSGHTGHSWVARHRLSTEPVSAFSAPSVVAAAPRRLADGLIRFLPWATTLGCLITLYLECAWELIQSRLPW